MGYGIERQSTWPEMPPKNEEIKFQINPELVNKIKTISQIRPNWDKIQQQIDSCIKNPNLINFEDNNIYSLISEFHLRNCVDEINDSYKIFTSDQKSQHFVFKREENGRLDVLLRDKIKDRSWCEYDGLFYIDNFFVIFEVKIGILLKADGKNKSFINAMSDEKINHIFTPLKEYLRMDNFGYVIFAPQEIINNSVEEQKFIDKGGIIIPFYTHISKFKKEVLANIEISRR